MFEGKKINLWGPGPGGYEQAELPYPLDAAAESAAEIRAVDVLQRYSHTQAGMILCDWVRVLAPEGVLRVSVPDVLAVLREYEVGTPFDVMGELYGRQQRDCDTHQSGYDEECLRELLEGVGLVDVQPWEPDAADASALPRVVRLQGRKPALANLEPEAPADLAPVTSQPAALLPGLAAIREQLLPTVTSQPQVAPPPRVLYPAQAPLPLPLTNEAEALAWRERCQRVKAIMSLPRLAFTDNLFCTLKAFTLLGIDCLKSSGAFWGQCMTRLFEAVYTHGELILVLDYDTVFTTDDVLTLIRLMDANPGVDAIAPLQVQREQEVCLFNPPRDGMGQPRTSLRLGELDTDLYGPIRTAHFGLTVLRASAFGKLARPWFWSQPTPTGDWGPGHIDDDMWFWREWEKAGNTLYLAPRVVVGHMQLMVTWPTPDLKAYHQFINQWDSTGKPAAVLKAAAKRKPEAAPGLFAPEG